MKTRILQTGILFILGLVYYIALTQFSFSIPCIFHKITGLLCPGCGITRMILAMLRLDLHAAFAFNPFLFATQPILLYFIIKNFLAWLKGKNVKYNKIENVILVLYLISFIVFGILRNCVELDMLIFVLKSF